MELNVEQVKRGIECLENKIDRDCDNCSIYWKHARTPTVTRNCRHIILDDALALINSQEQKIKELTEENERLRVSKGIAIFASPTRMAEYIKLGLAVHFGTYTENDTVKIKDVFGAIDKITEEMPDER